MSEELDHVCQPSYECKILVTLEVIGGKELKRRIPAVTQHMLTMHFPELENDGIVICHIYRQIPPKGDYILTSFGESLKSLVTEITIRDRSQQ
uniref:winged helix-turn-helix transcriptional regulator n=1 Tax=Paenibacillus sp. FSL H8-0079 TaxID=2921375 RepID=UPI00403F19F7